jgi:hypothetical protein
MVDFSVLHFLLASVQHLEFFLEQHSLWLDFLPSDERSDQSLRLNDLHYFSAMSIALLDLGQFMYTMGRLWMFDLSRGALFLFERANVLITTLTGLIIFVFIFQSLVSIILSYILLLKNLLFG